MKRKTSKTQLALLSILAGAVYLFIIMPDLEHELLLLGVILLIATNVMKRAITLKVEQDLTI